MNLRMNGSTRMHRSETHSLVLVSTPNGWVNEHTQTGIQERETHGCGLPVKRSHVMLPRIPCCLSNTISSLAPWPLRSSCCLGLRPLESKLDFGCHGSSVVISQEEGGMNKGTKTRGYRLHVVVGRKRLKMVLPQLQLPFERSCNVNWDYPDRGKLEEPTFQPRPCHLLVLKGIDHEQRTRRRSR